jgi:competence protein ComEC
MASSLHPGDFAFGGALLFLVGVFAVSLGWHSYVLFIAALLGAAFLATFKKWLWKECLFFFLAIFAGVLYYHAFFRLQDARRNMPFGTFASFSAVISDEPSPSQKYLMITADAQPPLVGTILILAPPESNFNYGDLLHVDGVINPPDAEGGDPVVFSPKITVTAAHRGFWLREWMINLKLAILDRFNVLLPEDQAALLGGITFGSKQNFKPDFKSAMALAGLTHLVAISGYNITIVIFAAGQVFGRFFSRRATFYFAIVLLILFMFMVGGAASGVRAAIMGFLALIAREAGRAFSMRNAITMTAALMVLFDPTALTGNMSFVLSYLSLLGIVYVQPPLKKLLRRSGSGAGDDGDGMDNGVLGWKESALTTLSAQSAVMPVLITTFGQFSATAIVANVLVLGTVPLTMFFGLLLAMLAFLSRYLAFFVAQLAGLLLGYQISVIWLFAKLAVPLPLPVNSTFSIFLYYLLLCVFVFLYGNEGRNKNKDGNSRNPQKD